MITPTYPTNEILFPEDNNYLTKDILFPDDNTYASQMISPSEINNI